MPVPIHKLAKCPPLVLPPALLATYRGTPALSVKISFAKLRAEGKDKMRSSVMVLAKCGCTIVAPVSPESVSKF